MMRSLILVDTYLSSMFLDFGAKALKAQNLMSETLPFLGTHFACIIVMTGDICAVRRPSVKGGGMEEQGNQTVFAT